MTSKKGKTEDASSLGEELPESFHPSKYDVIVGWARQNYHHEGNQMLRSLVRDNVPRYMAAKSKHDKGTIIVEILDRIRKESPTGLGLVRQNPETGRWFYIGTDKAKDKIGHALRKASRDFAKGIQGSPVKQQRQQQSHQMLRNVRMHNSSSNNNNHRIPVQQHHAFSGTMAPGNQRILPNASSSSNKHMNKNPHDAFPANVATESYKLGPSALETWPLTSVTSLSSSDSNSEDPLSQRRPRQQPVQVTVPSSPVTRPSSAASNSNTDTEAQQQQQQLLLLSPHPLSPIPVQNHHQPPPRHRYHDDSSHASYYASYNHASYGKEGYNSYHHRPYYYHSHPSGLSLDNDLHHRQEEASQNSSLPVIASANADDAFPKAAASSSPLAQRDHHHSHSYHHQQQQQHHHHHHQEGHHPYAPYYPPYQHQHPPPPPPSSDGAYHRVFDDVEGSEGNHETNHDQHYSQQHYYDHGGHAGHKDLAPQPNSHSSSSMAAVPVAHAEMMYNGIVGSYSGEERGL